MFAIIRGWRPVKTQYQPAEHLPAVFAEKSFANRMATANAISEQIWREQQLVSTRMTWNFSFQGFLALLFVYAGSNLEDLEKFLIQVILGIVGMLVTRSIWLAVEAAQAQSSRLKEHWISIFCDAPPAPSENLHCDIRSGAFPQPFSPPAGSRKGRGASTMICMILLCMWSALCLTSGGLALRDHLLSGKPAAASMKSHVGEPDVTRNSGDLTAPDAR